MKSTTATVVKLLMERGEYKLALRALLTQHRLLKLERAKKKHNQKWEKLKNQTIQLHKDIDVVVFEAENRK